VHAFQSLHKGKQSILCGTNFKIVKLFCFLYHKITRGLFRAIQNLVRPNYHDSQAVEARQDIDLRIGAAFTRFQTIRIRNRFPQFETNLISYGPCQFPTLGFVVDRYLRSVNFQPEPFWYIFCSYEKSDSQKVDFTWKRGHLFNRLACLVLYERCVENPVATVVRAVKREKRKWRPLPLNTVELQKLAARKLRMSAQRTMQLAEELYNKSLISYPRTETDMFNFRDDELMPLIASQNGDPRWGTYADEYVLFYYVLSLTNTVIALQTITSTRLHAVVTKMIRRILQFTQSDPLVTIIYLQKRLHFMNL